MGAAISSCFWPSMEENERKLRQEKTRLSLSSLSAGGTDECEFAPPSPISVSVSRQRHHAAHATQFVEKKAKSRKASRIVSDLRRNEGKKTILPDMQDIDIDQGKVRSRRRILLNNKDPCAANASCRTVDSTSTCAEIVDTKNLERIFDCMQIEERSLWAQYGSDVFTPVTSDFNEWGAMVPSTSTPSYRAC